MNLENDYAHQLDEIGRILVRAKIIKASEIRRQGVHFAIRDQFEPQQPRTHRRARGR